MGYNKIDIDIYKDDRPAVFQHCIDTFGVDKTAFVQAIGTVVELGSIDEIGRALGYSVKDTKEIKEEYSKDHDKARKKYKDLFYYFDGFKDTCVSQSRHAAGIVISPITLDDNYGTLEDSEGHRVLQLDMEAVHEVGLAKYDLLGLRNIGTISKAFELAGRKYPRSDEIDWDDKEVWDSMLESPVGLFQMEGSYSFQMLCKFKPQNIFDMSLVTAMIRPSGASYRDELVQRHIHKNPSKQIDELLKDNLGYLVYQCDIIAFLQDICGLSGGEADNVRRAIGRKQVDRLEAALPGILEGYCNSSDKPREVAEKEAKEFLQVIEDASSYMFGKNHSIAYCMIGYLCAYLRHYYPLEFLTASFNTISSKEDIAECTALSNLLKIKVLKSKFRYSKAKYFMDKDTNSIYKGIESIQYMNSTVADEMYALKDNRYNTFFDLLKDLKNKTSLTSKQLDILIKLDFFEEFGNSRKLLHLNKIFDFFKQGEAKVIAKSKISNDDIMRMIVARNSTETDKQYRELCIDKILKECYNYIDNMDIKPFMLKDKMAWQKEFCGYVDVRTGKEEDRCKLLITEVKPLNSRRTGKLWRVLLKTTSIGSGKQSEVMVEARKFNNNPIHENDIIFVTRDDLHRDNWGDRHSVVVDKYKFIIM